MEVSDQLNSVAAFLHGRSLGTNLVGSQVDF